MKADAPASAIWQGGVNAPLAQTLVELIDNARECRRSDAADQAPAGGEAAVGLQQMFAAGGHEDRHCEERSDDAIQFLLLRFPEHWIASLRSQ
jgi:hypothetical protein